MRGGAGRKCLLLLAAFLLAVLVMRLENASFAAAGEELGAARLWSDGFFVSAVLFAAVGILSLVSAWGGFDGLAYGARFLVARFTRRDGGGESYFDYVREKGREREERNARRRERGGLHPVEFVVTGLVMLALSACAMLAQ